MKFTFSCFYSHLSNNLYVKYQSYLNRANVQLAILGSTTVPKEVAHVLSFRTFNCDKMGITQRYLMFVSYVGTGFRGSQLQIIEGCGSTHETVQYVLESGLKHVFQLTDERPIRVAMASRTDKDVHALKAALRVDLPQYKGDFIKPNSLKFLLNRYFKDFRSVRVLDIYTVPDSFSFCSSVLNKTYIYRYALLKPEFYDKRILFPPPVMEIGRTHLDSYPREFDLEKAKEAAALFEGTQDFGAIVGRPKHNTRPTVCNIFSFTVEPALPLVLFDPLTQNYDFYQFSCCGDRFLYHMVRRMVSLTISVALNILSLTDIKKLFDEPVPTSWPRYVKHLVPGYGLYLANINIDLGKINENKDEVSENKTEEISLAVES